jgi:hypothetical protein
MDKAKLSFRYDREADILRLAGAAGHRRRRDCCGGPLRRRGRRRDFGSLRTLGLTGSSRRLPRRLQPLVEAELDPVELFEQALFGAGGF